MPLFFFHLRTPKGSDLDDTGTEFPDLDADTRPAMPGTVPEGRMPGLDEPPRA